MTDGVDSAWQPTPIQCTHTPGATQFKGQPIRVPYAFVTEASEHPPFPRYRCPALVVHGLRDDVVPVETSTRALLAAWPGVREHTAVLVVDDDHGLARPETLKTAAGAVAEFLDIRSKKQQQQQQQGQGTRVRCGWMVGMRRAEVDCVWASFSCPWPFPPL